MNLLLAVALAATVVIIARWLFDPTTKGQAILAMFGMIIGLVGGLLVLQTLIENHHIAVTDRGGTHQALEAAMFAGAILGVIVAKVIRV